jgi:hypothetical protein
VENGIEPVWKNEIENSGYFPMKIEDKIKSGGSMTILEVKNVKRMNIGNDYFRPPEDFEKMKMPDMNSMKNFMQKSH